MAIELSLIGTYKTGVFDGGAAEIPAYDPTTQQLFVTNGDSSAVDVLNIADPTTPTLVTSIDISSYGSGLQSVAVKDGVVAIAVAATEDGNPGQVVFFSTAGEFLSAVTVGVLPDALTFTPDGTKIVVANEGEPFEVVLDDDDSDDDDGTGDDDGVPDDIDDDGGDDDDGDDTGIENPPGSISIIDLSVGVANLTDDDVTAVTFDSFIGQEETLRSEGIRIAAAFTAAHDFEPELAAISPDSSTAFVTLQENNAIAVVDLATGTVTDILPAGTVDFSSDSALDPSDEDGEINIANFPVKGLRQPDGIASYEVDGQVYYVLANEGDGRDDEAARVADLVLDPTAFPDAATLQLEENLGRLEVSAVDGDTDEDGDFDELYAFGGRSFSIIDSAGNLVFDSGDDFEQITAEMFPDVFNSTNDENISFDNRSDDGGPEPEGVAIGVVNGIPYAFIGLERIGGVMVYDISNPTEAEFVQYINTRNFSGNPETGTAGDLGPEGLVFISAEDSPTGVPLLAVTNEISGSTSIFGIDFAPEIVNPPASIDINIINIDVDIEFTIVDSQPTYVFTGSNTVNIIVTTIDIDIIVAGGGGDTIICGDGDDEADGGNGNDIIRGELGIDILIGGRGRDRIYGGDDDDDCDGDEGRDDIRGGDGDDNIDGGNQGDSLWGGIGIDIIIGGNGKDDINGGDDDDDISGDNGKDSIYCGDGDDDAEGGNSTDFINGGGGDDDVMGDDGNDLLIGGGGDDMLVGGNNNDILRGGDGDDMIVAGNGEDICIGGAGRDTFLLADGILFGLIRDFEIGVDFFGVSSGFSFESFTFEQSGFDTVVRFESSTVAVIQNIDVTLVTQEIFVEVEVNV